MTVEILKFVHVLITLALLSTTGFCLVGAFKKTTQTHYYKWLIYLAVLALITGSLLVEPRHFSFHTPWIQAAYLLITIFASLVGFVYFSNLRLNVPVKIIIYSVLLIILLLIVHDAVTKSTLFNLGKILY